MQKNPSGEVEPCGTIDIPAYADWGSDWFVAICHSVIASGRFLDARELLLGWARHVSVGRRVDSGGNEWTPQDAGSIDGALRFAIVAKRFIQAADCAGWVVTEYTRETLLTAADHVFRGCEHGTRRGIYIAENGLLSDDKPGRDAWSVGVSPRTQTLWLSALEAWIDFWPRLAPLFDLARNSIHGAVEPQGGTPATRAADQSLIAIT